MNYKLDTSGKDCPIPLMELKKSIKGKNKGDVIDLTFTCPEAVNNIPEYCEKIIIKLKNLLKIIIVGILKLKFKGEKTNEKIINSFRLSCIFIYGGI